MVSLSNPSPTGEQFTIHHGDLSAVVCEVGATLRSLSAAGVELIDGFDPASFSLSGRGQVLAPWPGRLDHGTFAFDGVSSTAPINDVEHNAAIHGLVRWRSFELLRVDDNRVVLGSRIYPSPSYPYSVVLTIEYAVGPDGLVVTSTAQNVGSTQCPFALGFHTYLSVGALIDGAELRFPGRSTLLLNDRLIPTGEIKPVKGSTLDFTQGHLIGDAVLDTTFSELVRDTDTRARAVLAHQGTGQTVELWVDEQFGYLQLFTGDTIGDVPRRRLGLAVEPMTSPPNALQSGVDVIILAPLQEWRGQFGVRALP